MDNINRKQDVKDLTKDELLSWLKDHKIAPFRADQILKWCYLKQTDSFDLMTDLSRDFRAFISEHFKIARLKTEAVEESKDGSRKYLFRLEDGEYVEAVLMPERDHYTLCISCQVGCAQKCRFCLTAKNGFTRNLTKGEILAQIRDIRLTLKEPGKLKNLVFMGMGEPLANYRNVINAIETITDSDFGLQFSGRRVTLSTSGLVSRFKDLGKDVNINLAISLNATDDKTRDFLMPINRTNPIGRLIDACRHLSLKPRQRITFEYILLKGINDSDHNAAQLVKLLTPVKAKVNLIPFNEFEGSGFQRPDESTILRFQKILRDKNVTAMLRQSKGADISAACGQLKAKREK